MTMITAEDILQVMDIQAKTVCSRTFVPERPNATTTALDEFIVCSLPYSFSNKTMGENDDWWVDVTVVFEIYVADRVSAQNPKEMNVPVLKSLRESLFDLFPIIDTTLGIKIVRPRTVIPAASDGNGYHFTRIQAKMTTLT